MTEAGAGGLHSLVIRIADEIGRSIIEGRLRPGGDLNSVELSKKFNTSRTPVREALLLLSKEGLVDMYPRRRPRVSTISLQEIREIYAIRVALNSVASEQIVATASDADLERLAQLLPALRAAEQRGDVDGYFWGTVEFRDCELEICNNVYLRRMLDSLRMRMHQLRRMGLSVASLARARGDIERLVLAYRDRDAHLAVAINRSIVLSALGQIEANWTGQTQSVDISSESLDKFRPKP
jgi:DNA-binding GntR family transcriptional regulator